MILIYAFGAFLFYKIAAEFMDFQGVSVLWAALAAATSALIVLGANAASMTLARGWVLRIELSGRREPMPVSVYATYAAAAVVAAVAGVLIAAGFARELYLNVWGWYGFRDDTFWFGVLMAIPVIAYAPLPLFEISMIGRAANDNLPPVAPQIAAQAGRPPMRPADKSSGDSSARSPRWVTVYHDDDLVLLSNPEDREILVRETRTLQQFRAKDGENDQYTAVISAVVKFTSQTPHQQRAAVSRAQRAFAGAVVEGPGSPAYQSYFGRDASAVASMICDLK